MGEYIKRDSILHKLDARVKLIGAFSLIFSFLFIKNLESYFVALFFAGILIFLSKISFINFLKGLKNIFYILLFTSVFHIYSNQIGKLVLQIWEFKIYDTGLIISLKIILKIIIIIIFSSILTLTTKPYDIALALETLLKPLKKVGFPVQECTFMISMTLSFIPMILKEIEIIKLAQQARGKNFETKNPFIKLYNYSEIFIPLLVSLIEKIENLSFAMEARAYNIGIERTKFYKLKFQRQDYIAGVFIIFVFLFFIIV